ncbi:MAG TPA: DUF6526 family protein [Holophagaceae bacterium]|nr:DUF6526 family protein [Holophagaceae bacterium]
MAKPPQTYANHRRIDPRHHILLFGLFAANLVVAVVAAVRHPGGATIWAAAMALALLLLLFEVRIYALQNQDRLIRLEERLRLERLLPEDLRTRLPELKVGQIVALRFASDAEVADRMREALTESLDGEAIKRRIQTWRPDTFRI